MNTEAISSGIVGKLSEKLEKIENQMIIALLYHNMTLASKWPQKFPNVAISITSESKGLVGKIVIYKVNR